jgi:hypothetical protein
MSQRKSLSSLTNVPAATPIRELPSTARHTTAKRVRHGWLIALATSLAGIAACGGGGGHSDTYKKATSEQERCCENLNGPDRDACMQSIVRVDNPDVAATDTNQATYRCIEDHFVCDPSTGHPSPESAQAQYDCIADLGQ